MSVFSAIKQVCAVGKSEMQLTPQLCSKIDLPVTSGIQVQFYTKNIIDIMIAILNLHKNSSRVAL